MQSEQVDKLIPALLAARNEMGAVTKNASNPFYKSKYADLATVQEVCDEPLFKNGLVVTQGGCMTANGNGIYTQITHTSGQWMRSELPLILAKQDPQGVGSAITYFRRYGLTAMLNLVQEDDDGNAASKPYEEKSGTEKLKQAQLDQLLDFKEAGFLTATAKEKWQIDAPKWLKLCGKSKMEDLTEAQADKLIKECEKKVPLKPKD